jgi:DNA-binding PadR family transcriptional regulator
VDAPINAAAALLEALSEGSSYGLELIERVERRTDGKLKLRHGSVYPALRSLERNGFVRSCRGESVPETAGRPRRYYELTAKGRAAAAEQRQVVWGLFRLTSGAPG